MATENKMEHPSMICFQYFQTQNRSTIVMLKKREKGHIY
uniref:Ribosomal protein n=1 Tax=Rhizophora mucronata TaxID=61149 RepID=A0A2P2J5A1_RHIMU